MIPLAEARDRALANHRTARDGGDPLQARRTAAAVMTFEDAAREWHRLNRPTWRSARHAAEVLATLEEHAFPRLGPLRVTEVGTSDVLAVLTPIWLKMPLTAKRVLQRIGAVMKWGEAKGWRTDNPAENVMEALPRQTAGRVPRKALHYEAVAACIAAVRACDVGLATKLAIEFIALTAARPIQAREAVWSEIDLERAVWTIPAERMKAAKAHRVPLSARAVAILREAETLARDDGYVFPGNRKGRPLSDSSLSKLVKELKFDADVHGFRTSFRTWTQERTEYPREVAEFALAHAVSDAAERAYARSDLFEKRREMMDAWAPYLAEMPSQVVGPGPTNPPASQRLS